MCPLELRVGHRGWSLFPTNKKWEHRKAIMPGKALKGSAKFQLSPFFLDISQSQGEQVLDKKGNNILDREANHKLGRETWF